MKKATAERRPVLPVRYLEIGCALNIYGFLRSFGGKVSEASFLKWQKTKPSGAAQNMLLSIRSIFRRRTSTQNMDIVRYSGCLIIRIPAQGFITLKICNFQSLRRQDLYSEQKEHPCELNHTDAQLFLEFDFFVKTALVCKQLHYDRRSRYFAMAAHSLRYLIGKVYHSMPECRWLQFIPSLLAISEARNI